MSCQPHSARMTFDEKTGFWVVRREGKNHVPNTQIKLYPHLPCFPVIVILPMRRCFLQLISPSNCSCVRLQSPLLLRHCFPGKIPTPELPPKMPETEPFLWAGPGQVLWQIHTEHRYGEIKPQQWMTSMVWKCSVFTIGCERSGILV